MASRRANKLALKYQRAIEKATRKGIRKSNALSLGLFKDLIAAFKKGNTFFDPIIADYSLVFTLQVESSAILAHLLGMVMFKREAERSAKAQRLASGVFLSQEDDELRQQLINAGFGTARPGVPNVADVTEFAIVPSAAQISELADEINLSDIKRQQIANRYQVTARTAGREFDKRLNLRLTDAVQDITANQLTEAQGVKRIKEAFTLAGTSARHDYWYTTIYRTETQIAFAGGRWDSATDPILSELLWGFAYVDFGDDKVRPQHKLADGTRLPKNHPWWTHNFAPNGFNCRCSCIEVFEPEKIVLPKTLVVYDTEAFNTDWKPAPVVPGL